MVEKPWSLSDEQRAETVTRVAQNIESLAFSRGVDIKDARTIAGDVEKKAYTVATVEATTTTGFRPHDEVLKSYARCRCYLYWPLQWRMMSFGPDKKFTRG